MESATIANKSIAIVGPTACGKTHRAVEIASSCNGEIISADSRQIYKGMDLGTGKDLDEYGNIPYHLIDICDAGEKFNLHQYLHAFKSVYKDIIRRGKTPIICGGSGMYIENAIRGISLPEVPENPSLRSSLEKLSLEELTDILKQYKTLHNKTDVDTSKRAIRAIEICEYYKSNPEEIKDALYATARPLDCPVIGLDIPRDLRREFISHRLKKRLENGMIDEIKFLISSGIDPTDLIYYGLEYKYITLYVIGKLNKDQMLSQLETAIHQFAKRQMTWFRGMERRGIKINWVPYDIPKKDLLLKVNDLMKSNVS